MKDIKTIRVALLSSGLGHVKRGIETWTQDMAKALAEAGVRVAVYKGGGKRQHPYERVILCLKRSNPFAKWLIRVRPSFLWRWGLSTVYTLEEMTFTLNLLPILLLRQFSIIHTQDPDVAYILQKLRRWGILKSRVILAHGTEEPFEFLKNFDYIQHLAPYHLEEAILHGCHGKKSFVIGNFVDTQHFAPDVKTSLRQELNIPAEAFVVLSVAAIKRTHKRIDHLINEIAKTESSVYLVVAGATGEESPALMESAKVRLGPRAVFLPDFPRERVHEVYAIADVFVLASLKEMMPIALLEALASGVPAVVHRYPVEQWMIGIGGESIDMTREGELAAAVRKYTNRVFHDLKSQQAREQAVRLFAKDVIMKQVLTMYQNVLE